MVRPGTIRVQLSCRWRCWEARLSSSLSSELSSDHGGKQGFRPLPHTRRSCTDDRVCLFPYVLSPGGGQSEVVQRGKVLGEGVDNALSVSVVSRGDLQNDGLDAGSGEIRQAGGHVRGFA